MTVDEAIAFASQHFPTGPESLAKHLRIDLRYAEMSGCDGWCLAYSGRCIIRVNSAQVNVRQRFTLAHELAHFLLGIPSVIGESFQDMLGSDSQEEIRVNRLAAELLMPLEIVKKYVKTPPVAAQSLERLAKAANVSPLSAALRVANSVQELNLERAAVLLFEGDKFKWVRSSTMHAPDKSTCVEILSAARTAHPSPFRRIQENGLMVVASLFENQYFNSTTVFVQLLDPAQGAAQSYSERRSQMELELFPPECKLRPSVEGCLSAIKKKFSKSPLAMAEAAFWERYTSKFAGTTINSDQGKDYIRLRLSEWCA